MENDNIYLGFKYSRVLQIYTKLLNGDIINKSEEAKRFGVNVRSIQRDLDDLKAFFENQNIEVAGDKTIVYDRELNGYYLMSKNETMLTDKEALVICKILLESRAFRKDEIEPVISKILNHSTSKKKQSVVREMIANELYHYVEPQHKRILIDFMWDIGVAVKEHYFMNICYMKQNGSVVDRKVKPVGIMFSEFYFYMLAFIDGIDKEKAFDNKDDMFPTIYRIDRIQRFEVLKERFDVPYRDRFEEGEFRKRVQFMYGGKLRRIKFLYKGNSIEAVLDRMPTARIVEKTEEGCVVTAEVFGEGVDMWLMSQGENVVVM